MLNEFWLLGPSSYGTHSVGTVEVAVNESLLQRQLMNQGNMQMVLRGVGEAGPGRNCQLQKMPWSKRDARTVPLRQKEMPWGPETDLQLCIFCLVPFMLGLYHSRFPISPGWGQLEFFISNALKTIESSSSYPFCCTRIYWLVNLSTLYRLCRICKFHQNSILTSILQ